MCRAIQRGGQSTTLGAGGSHQRGRANLRGRSVSQLASKQVSWEGSPRRLEKQTGGRRRRSGSVGDSSPEGLGRRRAKAVGRKVLPGKWLAAGPSVEGGPARSRCPGPEAAGRIGGGQVFVLSGLARSANEASYRMRCAYGFSNRRHRPPSRCLLARSLAPLLEVQGAAVSKARKVMGGSSG